MNSGLVANYSVSPDTKYLAINTGSDTLGSIKIYNINTGELVYSDGYTRHELIWNNDSLEYQSTVYTTLGVAIWEKVIFNDGIITITNEQGLKAYHGIGDENNNPFVEDYNTYKFINNRSVKSLFSSFINFAEDHNLNYNILSIISENPKSLLSNTELSQLIDFCLLLGDIYMADNTKQSRREAIKFFEYIYPYIDYNARNSSGTVLKNSFIDEYMQIVKLNKELLIGIY